MQGSEGSSPEDDAGASEDAGDPDGVPSPDDVDRALKRLWSGDASSLERLVPANRDEIPLDRVAKGLRVAPVPPPRPATDETPVPVEVRGYTILHSIGRGGMGDVFLAEQHHPRRSVALKVARTGRERDAARDHLLVHEAQMLARLQHPWIATIYDVGETDDGRRTIAMEPVEGTRLDRWLQAENRPLRTRLELFRKLCAAVHYAHEQGVVHRDLKPTNVLVDRGGDPKILDFGLAQDREAAQPLDPMFLKSGRLIGTLPYMSPEQVTGRFEEVDRRSDVYSLGVMLYQALTGRLPYPIHADRPGEAVRAICELPPTPPRVLDRRIPPAVEAIVLRALQKARGDRYATAADMQQDLAQSLQAVALRGTGGSVPTRPETWSPPFLATVLLGFVALGLGLGAAVTKALSTDRRPRAGTVDESAEATRGTSHFYNQAIAALDVVDLDPARPNESMLDLLADRLAADAQLSPRARARLCIHLARRYESRELLDRAVLLYERAFELRLLEFGEASERTRNVLLALARLRLRLGHLDAAEAAARSLLATSLAAEGESPATQRARRLLADVLDASGQSEEAAALRAAIVDEDPAAAPGDADADADEE